MSNKSAPATTGRSPDGPKATPDGSATSERTPSSSPRLIDLGRIEDLQVLSESGVIEPSLDPGLSDAELRRVHRAMVLTRKFDVRMLTMQRQGKMGTFAPGFGQEATQIGQVYPLTDADWYAPSYRSFGAQIWRGWEMERLLLLWDGFFAGFPPPAGVNDLPFSIVIGSHVPTAVGVAMGLKYRGSDAVAMTNFGDGALSQGPVAEAFTFAARFKAPVVFVCENNGWAISTPTCRQCGHDILARRGSGFGIPSMRVDGNDVLGMIRAAQHAVEHARSGEGPMLIEALTYRMGVHTTADDPTVYRKDAEVEAWKPRCPIRRLELYLKARGLLDDDEARRIAEQCEQEVAAARARFDEQAVPRPREVFDNVYEHLPPELEEQKREYLDKLDRKGVD